MPSTGMEGRPARPPRNEEPSARTHWNLIRLSDSFCLSIGKDPSNYLKQPALLSTRQSETTVAAINIFGSHASI